MVRAVHDRVARVCEVTTVILQNLAAAQGKETGALGGNLQRLLPTHYKYVITEPRQPATGETTTPLSTTAESDWKPKTSPN